MASLGLKIASLPTDKGFPYFLKARETLDESQETLERTQEALAKSQEAIISRELDPANLRTIDGFRFVPKIAR